MIRGVAGPATERCSCAICQRRQLAANLEAEGRPLADADLQIAATALRHDLVLVTGNVGHFERVPGLELERALADAREGR